MEFRVKTSNKDFIFASKLSYINSIKCNSYLYYNLLVPQLVDSSKMTPNYTYTKYFQ